MARVQEESGKLAEIQKKKVEIVASMKERQKKYMDGVEQLNQQREATIRGNLEMMEQGLDSVKSQWYKLFQEVQKVEQEEKQQYERLFAAEKELRAVSTLEEQYTAEFRKAVAKKEQDQIDEYGIRKHTVGK